MKVLDDGHLYDLRSYSGSPPDEPDPLDGRRIRFMKREGPGYPGNVGHYDGTNMQEVLRVLIDRVRYLDRQVPSNENTLIVDHLRACIRILEMRAAARHGRKLAALGEFIESVPACKVCGHIHCQEHP